MTQEQAFTRAFDEYADALFRHCFFRVGDRERAREIVQDTFMKTWDYISNGGEVNRYRPFLYRVLNNLIIDEYRKKRVDSLDELLEKDGVVEGHFEDLVTESDTEAALDAAREADELHRALQDLSEEYRTVVAMRYIDGLSPREIAKMIGENTNVVSVRIHRGVAQLKKKYGYA